MAQSDEDKIKLALDRLDDNQKRLYAEAVKEGYSDAVCPLSKTVFLAFHHFIACNHNDCPMIERKADGTRGPSVLEMMLGPTPPRT